MTNTESKALALVNELRTEGQMAGLPSAHAAYGIYGSCWLAICRVIEREAATEARHAAELRELKERFSEAVERVLTVTDRRYETHAWRTLSPFVLPAPDPLMEAMKEVEPMTPWEPQDAKALRAAIEKRGGKIVWGEG